MFDNQKDQIIASLTVPAASKSWLVVGPHGIGKKSFAEQLVVALTKNKNQYNPSVKWIECGLTDTAKKEIQKAILAGEQLEEKEWAKKKQISVDDVREACHFLSLKSNKIKVLVFNLADDMNEEAQNALLKTLEEPYPNSLILLLTENIGHLLPTILSRCQKVILTPPSFSELDQLIHKKHPELSPDERKEVAELADYMPGVVEDIINHQGRDIFYQIQNLLVPKSQLNGSQVLAFAETISKDKDDFALARRFLLKIIAQKAKDLSFNSVEKSYTFAKLYDAAQTLFAQIDEVNLDKKYTIVSIIHQISEAL